MRRIILLAFALTACSVPASNDGESRVLAVTNGGNAPIIGLFVGKPGTTPATDPNAMDLEILPSNDGRIDRLPLSARIAPGETRRFNVDDGEGTCVFEVAVHFIGGRWVGTESDVCELNRSNLALTVSGRTPEIQNNLEPGDADALVESGSIDDARAANNSGDFKTAARILRPLAENGDAEAQFGLGSLYDKGSGVPQDYAEAAKWYRLAAEQGDATAQFTLGYMYDNGDGVPQNYPEALRWMRLAAAQGQAGAQTYVGSVYVKGGNGIPQDLAEAERLFRLAAERGYADAQTNLGTMYYKGLIAPKGQLQADDVLAYMWWTLAVAQGPRWAVVRNQMKVVARRMTREQIAEAERLARDWKPT